MLPVAILAGGLATRLRPITQTIPKALIKVAGKYFIDHQLEYLSYQGITSVVLCIGYLGEMIKEFVGDGSRWNMQVSYSQDGPVLLGTGGALKQALPLLGDNFFVLYGDSYLPIDYTKIEAYFKKYRKLGLMTIYHNNNKLDKSNVYFDNGQIIKYSKKQHIKEMQHIDYGLGILSSQILEGYPINQPFDLALAYAELALQKQLVGYEVYERFYEIGSKSGILDAEEYLLKKVF